MPILKGVSVMIYIGSNKTTARITKINCKYDPKTGAVIKKNCKSIHSNDCVEIEVESDQKVCIEKFSNSKIFGRVIIREKKSTLCVGTVTMIK
jgi:translation elongation factor EF-1alpha